MYHAKLCEMRAHFNSTYGICGSQCDRCGSGSLVIVVTDGKVAIIAHPIISATGRPDHYRFNKKKRRKSHV